MLQHTPLLKEESQLNGVGWVGVRGWLRVSGWVGDTVRFRFGVMVRVRVRIGIV